MRSTDRDFYMSTISVLQSQRRMIQSIADDMCMYLDQLEEQITMQYDQLEDHATEELLDSAWQSGYDYNKLQEEEAMLDYEDDTIIYDTLRNKYKLCMCDKCWDVDDEMDEFGAFYTPDESKKNSSTWVDDALNKMRRAPQDYRMD